MNEQKKEDQKKEDQKKDEQKDLKPIRPQSCFINVRLPGAMPRL